MENGFRWADRGEPGCGPNGRALIVIVLLRRWGRRRGVPKGVPGPATGWYLVGAVVGAVLFLVSLLAHELAHALVARRVGVAVESITFWLFGGVARLAGDASSPSAALWIALVGPHQPDPGRRVRGDRVGAAGGRRAAGRGRRLGLAGLDQSPGWPCSTCCPARPWTAAC